ncbi:MAG TPA: NAD(P)(+) transhydrogenase (Re/Si-specific) subunit beta [Planctomycetaceae bacterium]|nr:NAD(P)(+) transhydrogenase (Re/Si-specific) subunit beta [Planctomycetaceae bacterium]
MPESFPLLFAQTETVAGTDSALTAVVNLTYILASILFIVGLKGLSHPRSAVRGNLLGAIGMLLAIVVTLFDQNVLDYKLIVVGLVIGSAIGTFLALRCPMTSMPQLVALLNGFGGAASLLVGGAVLAEPKFFNVPNPLRTEVLIATAASGWIGAITLWGSLVAYAKLEEFKFIKDVRFNGQQFINLGLTIVSILLGVWLVMSPPGIVAYWLMVLLASALGVLLVIFIGGADMPVVIALFNSYSGLAAAATGFVLSNSVLIISGSLVGASGIILTQIMCKAMNRSAYNVFFGVMAGGGETAKADEVYASVKSTSADEIAMLLDIARRVVIVPGYGLAVAQAQHAVRDLTTLLEAKGITVEFAIHPVAGRMPGHMNVLLAEADIPYESLKEMDDINPTLAQADVALVIGANDVVNPLARTDPKSPIAGMPIIDVDKARTVIVIKRSLSPGFAGIPNPLFAADNSLLFFADGRKAIMDIIGAVESL